MSSESPSVEELPPSEPTVTRRKRLARDRIGQLTDQVDDNPLDIDGWLALVAEYRTKDRLSDVRETYETMLKRFPYSAEIWTAYIGVELDHSEFQKVEQLFGRCLTKVLKVTLWEQYLAYIRRVNSGNNARETIQQAYEFSLERIGNDPQSGPVWLDYLNYIKSIPTTTNLEQQQLMDLTRKTYRRALCIPLNSLEVIWQGYNNFETGLNKSTARKFIADRSATYMTARSSYKEFQNITQGLDTNTLPRQRQWTEQETQQSLIWQKWIKWELKNPLEASSDILGARVLYAYKQALMTLWYYPEWWFDAANYCLKTLDNTEQALEFLSTGLQANPHSFLLTLKAGQVYGIRHLGTELHAVFRKLIDNLKKERVRLGGDDPTTESSQETPVPEENPTSKTSSPEKELNARDITFAYTEYMKAVQRLEGIKDARKIFSECRKLVYCTPQIYVSSAMMEYYNSKESGIASKVFEIGIRRFGDNAEYVKKYFDFLVLSGDESNARALFEKSLLKMDKIQQKTLFHHFMKYENDYGDLTGIVKLEERYSDMFPEENAVELFVDRYKELPSGYNPVEEIDFGKRYVRKRKNDDIDDDENESRRKRLKEAPQGPKIPESLFALMEKLPSADVYDTVRFNSENLIGLIQTIEIPELEED